jgi:hypothetical protein
MRPVVLLALLAAGPAQEPSDVLFTCDFEKEDWLSTWGGKGQTENFAIVDADPALKFEPLRGKALRVKIHKDGHYGGSLQYRFRKQSGSEPEEIYFRYSLRFADDWDPPRGGKLPGIAGTYGKAGWGGRRVNGTDGWSARGLFLGRKDGKTPIGFYCYHADQRTKYGDHFVWEREGLGFLENNRWYAVEQHVKLNTPGKKDGVLRGWIDGKPAYERTDLRFRDVDTLRIEEVWLNFYHGGTAPSPSDDHLYIDEVSVSRKPMIK